MATAIDVNGKSTASMATAIHVNGRQRMAMVAAMHVNGKSMGDIMATARLLSSFHRFIDAGGWLASHGCRGMVGWLVGWLAGCLAGSWTDDVRS